MVRWHRSVRRWDSIKVACCKMAELELRCVTRVGLDRTGEKSEDVVGATTGVEFSQPIR